MSFLGFLKSFQEYLRDTTGESYIIAHENVFTMKENNFIDTSVTHVFGRNNPAPVPSNKQPQFIKPSLMCNTFPNSQSAARFIPPDSGARL